MYEVRKNGCTVLEADACGIGFVATRKGVAERGVVELGLDLARRFDHRGAPGHGAGVLLDIPWPMLLDRFPEYAKPIAQRDVALGMFFLPFDGPLRRQCVEAVERVASVAGAEVLQWADVPIDPEALPPSSSARRTLPVVRQALFHRPSGLSEDGWFACRYLLRLALDSELDGMAGDEFSVVSLSNRTVVYKGLAELSRVDDLYPDLRDPGFASRFVVFHSRYCTNTTTAWRRAQPFWALAHNGEIATIRGNVAWMQAIGKGLIRSLAERHPSLARLAERVGSVVCSGGSDSANLDDMLISLAAGGMTLTQALLALLPASRTEDPRLALFYETMGVYLGACDGPAAVVACDGDEAVAHLDRNGLRPLWVAATEEYVFASSEPVEPLPVGTPLLRRCLGPGETLMVRLATGSVLSDGDPGLLGLDAPPSTPAYETPVSDVSPPSEEPDLPVWQRAFGMTREDLDVLLEPLFGTGKLALGSMGDDTSPAALLDTLPRRLEDHFALRFAQETSPPIDPIRDQGVFYPRAWVGDRSGLWGGVGRGLFSCESRVLSSADARWL